MRLREIVIRLCVEPYLFKIPYTLFNLSWTISVLQGEDVAKSAAKSSRGALEASEAVHDGRVVAGNGRMGPRKKAKRVKLEFKTLE